MITRLLKGLLSPALPGAFLLALCAFLGFDSSARGQERNFAGSAQASYLHSLTEPSDPRGSLSGFVAEASLKVAVDIHENVSASVKVCFGCHGFEVDMAYFDIVPMEELAVRVGRFNPTFGEFPLRHDPANHRTVDKPLPYDMGRMLRLREWNLGVLPSPYVDTGVEVSGVHWFGDDIQLSYAGYAVMGFQGDRDGFDFDFRQSRSLYYNDNNLRPAIGGRVAVGVDFGPSASMSVGASGMHGTYDPDGELGYWIAGADLFLNVGDFDFRAEYLIRRTEFALGDNPAQRFRYGPGDDGTFDNFFIKDGFYLEMYAPTFSWLDVVLRFDGLRRFGNVSVNSPLRRESSIYRYTLALQFLLDSAFTIKLSGELYDFSDFEDEVALTGALVGVF